MSDLLHVAVIATPSEKDASNKYLPLPVENVEFIQSVLDKAAPENYAAIYHGVESQVDRLVDDFAFAKHIRTKQFPAYWFDATSPTKTDKSAGLSRTEAMLRSLQDATTTYDSEAKARKPKDGTQGVVLIFVTKPVEDNRITKHAFDKATKYGLTIRVIELPVKAVNATAPDNSGAIPF